MKAKIVNFRLGRHTKSDTHMIIEVEKLTKEKAEPLIGKEVVWKSPAGKEIRGKIASLHGNKGRLRVIFEKGMPGQAINTEVEING